MPATKQCRGRGYRVALAPLVLSLATLAGACGDAAGAARESRLDALVDETSAALARSQAFGHELDFLRVLRGGLQSVGERSWVMTPDGALHVLTLRGYHQWNSTAEGRDRPRALDFDGAEHPVHDIVARAEMLREQGVDYLYVLVPSRLEIYPELILPDLAGAPDFPGMNPGTIAFQAELAQRGVETVPLLATFAANRFGPAGERWLSLRSQPAWSPAGVALAGRTIAERVRELPWYVQGPAVEGVDFQIDMRMLSMTAPLPPELQGAPGFEKPDELPIEAVLTRESLAAHVPDRESPIVLLGDSAVGIYEQLGGDLAGQIYRHLGHRLDVVSSASGDYWRTFESRPDPLAGKKLVIEVQSSGFRLPPTKHAPLPQQ